MTEAVYRFTRSETGSAKRPDQAADVVAGGELPPGGFDEATMFK
jgi:hypothetical protein